MVRAADPAAGGTRYLVVATIRKPHGVRGELALSLETDRPREVFRKGRELRLGDWRGRPSDETLTVERLVALLHVIEDPEAHPTPLQARAGS